MLRFDEANMNFYIDAVVLALALLPLGLGIFISLKIFNIPDITTDGSFTSGAAVYAVLASQSGWAAGSVGALAIGFLSGICTGLIHTRLKVNALLSGIITMTALYSVNIYIMGRSNIPLLAVSDVFDWVHVLSTRSLNALLVLGLFAVLLLFLLYRLLKSDYGLSMQATGNSESMIRSMGVNTNTQKITGLGIANAFTGLSGALVAQHLRFADVNMGIGIVIFGLGAVMMGEALLTLAKRRNLLLSLLSVLVGCLLFRLVMAACLQWGFDTNGLKLLTAVLVLLFVSLPQFKKRFG